MLTPIPRVDRDKELCQRKGGFSDFIRLGWHVVEPSHEYVKGWHIDAMAQHLEAVTCGEIEKLIINVPPGHAKSTIVSVLWPAWAWTMQPHLRFIAGSYALNLGVRDSIRMRELVASEWYQERWGDKVVIKDTKDTQAEYETTQRGSRYATSVGGSVTGRHAHIQILDDPLGALQAHSEAERTQANLWIDSALSTRWVPGEKQRRVVIMQRLHEDDPTGHLLKQGGYELLKLPAEYEPTDHKTSIGWFDPRTTAGDLLWPAMFPDLTSLKRQLGSYGAAGQLQQRPAPAEGGLFKRSMFRRYQPHDVPPKFDMIEICVDATFGETTGGDPDYVAIAVWGSSGTDSYLLRMARGRWGYVETKSTIKALLKSYPKAYRVRIEKKANGAALINELKSTVQGVVAYEPKESKMSRAMTSLPQVEAGQVWIPADEMWADEYLDEMASFPNGAHDDQVDATTMYLVNRTSSALSFLRDMSTR